MQARGTWTLLLDRIAEDSSEVGVEVLLGCVCVFTLLAHVPSSR